MTEQAFLPVLPVSPYASRLHARGVTCGARTGRAVGFSCARRRRGVARLTTHVVARADEPQSTNGSFALADLPTGLLQDAPARAGAYAVRDETGDLRYIGYARDVHARLAFHAEAVGVADAASCQWYAPESPVSKDVVSAENLEAVLEYWVQENGGLVPDGNLQDRARWERRKEEAAQQPAEVQSPQDAVQQPDPEVPFRQRRTAKRVPRQPRVAQGDRSTAAAFRSARADAPPPADVDDDYVTVGVDPLDPFSPASVTPPKKALEQEEGDDDWVPLVALAGIAAFMWLCSVIGNSMPAATPTLGM